MSKLRHLSDAEAVKLWGDTCRRCVKFEQMEKAKAIAQIAIGRSVNQTAKLLNISQSWVQANLDRWAMANATGMAPPEGTVAPVPFGGGSRDSRVNHAESRVVAEFAPDESEQQSEEFESFVEYYREEGYTDAIAKRMAKAEWAAEEAVEAGVIKEDTNKRNEKVNRILFPEDENATFELDLKMHMARVRAAAAFLDKAKVRNLRSQSTCERVAEADSLWRAQAELVLQHYQPSGG